ncbi:MAG: anaerobic ribonucleoside-triphosphate reductase activating protein [Sporomusaceae bacterium]|nr:anaerobic ribonucleoside-triphosphate reductase activating protein [Sporomusaceae bacterium]
MKGELGKMIRFADIIGESVVDGLGIRVVAFLQGCPRHCFGCHNEALLSPEGGKNMTEEALAELILAKLSPIHRGITFSGGDPLWQADALEKVISLVKAKKPNIDIWLYTGYVYEEVAELPLMKQIDVLIDGPFEMAQKSLLLPFRGSANQRVIDMRQTRVHGSVVEFRFDEQAAV